jgi:putative membrane protein
MFRHLPVTFGVMLALTGTAGLLRAIGGGPPATAPLVLSETDKQFLTRAGQTGESEIALARLAQTRATNDRVRALAATIEKECDAAISELKKLARKHEITLAPLSVAQRAAFEKLEKLSGAAFDQAFLAQIVKDHADAVALFSQGAKTDQPEVKSFAERKLPAFKTHLKSAQDRQKA